MISKIAHYIREYNGYPLLHSFPTRRSSDLLIAIALPTFLGARARAQNKAATSDLRSEERRVGKEYRDQDAYIYTKGACDDATLGPIEPSLNFVATGVASANGNNFAVSGGTG